MKKNSKKPDKRKRRFKPRVKKTQVQLPTADEIRLKARLMLAGRLSGAALDDELWNLLLDMAKEV